MSDRNRTLRLNSFERPGGELQHSIIGRRFFGWPASDL